MGSRSNMRKVQAMNDKKKAALNNYNAALFASWQKLPLKGRLSLAKRLLFKTDLTKIDRQMAKIK